MKLIREFYVAFIEWLAIDIIAEHVASDKDRIKLLEEELDARTSCRCGTDLDLHCSDVGCDHNKKDYGGFYLDRVQPWLDKPDKPGWWLVQCRDESRRCRYDARRVFAEDFSDPMSDYGFKQYLWKIIECF